jgi:hypothetical protein
MGHDPFDLIRLKAAEIPECFTPSGMKLFGINSVNSPNLFGQVS